MKIKAKNSIDDIISDPELNEQLKQLVIERFGTIPDNLKISMGSNELTKNDVLKHVEKGDDVGNQIMEMELGFLRDLASGAIYTYE